MFYGVLQISTMTGSVGITMTCDNEMSAAVWNSRRAPSPQAITNAELTAELIRRGLLPSAPAEKWASGRLELGGAHGA